jgi:8-oxo-dGTP pyrophosphatase MutT (NUDIX family)
MARVWGVEEGERSEVIWYTPHMFELKYTLKDPDGNPVTCIYRDGDPLDNPDNIPILGARAFAFYGDKMVLVSSGVGDKQHWNTPGGGVEPGETYEEAVVREVQEETNMRVISQQVIGYVDTFFADGPKRYPRSFCSVEPIGDFVGDPDHDVTEIKFIDPKDWKEYIGWFNEAMSKSLERALEIHKNQ